MKGLGRNALGLEGQRGLRWEQVGGGGRKGGGGVLTSLAYSWPPLGIPRLKLTQRWLKPELRVAKGEE